MSWKRSRTDRMAGGGWQAVRYCLSRARDVGGVWAMYRAMRTKNTCKTCALGMGGQRGGMVNEVGSFPEFCKKSVQAMAADMQPGIAESFWRTHSVEELKTWTPRELEAAGRLVHPLVVDSDAEHYRPVSWREAYHRIEQALLGASPDRTFWYFSGRSSNEAGFLLQLVARLYGSNHVNNCSYYCHQASGVGLSSALGSGTATIVWEDLEQTDCFFLIGGNPASNHPRLMTALADIRKRGGEVIVINPVREAGLERFKIPSRPWSLLFGSEIASLYVQPDIGGDLALLWGIAKAVHELGAIDAPFLREHCESADDFLGRLEHLTWNEIVACCGVSEEHIRDVAARYANSRKAVFAWTMGITHHERGVENVQAITNLALSRGMVGKPGAGLLPIRGHSNVQGIGSVGAVPKLKPEMAERIQQSLGLPLPEHEGMDTLACMEAAARGKVDFAFCLGGNLYGSNPDSRFAAAALAKIPTLVYLNTTLNTGHVWGRGKETIILPVLARDEEPYRTTQESMFNYVRLSEGGPARHAGPQPELHVIARVARGVLGDRVPVDWRACRQPEFLRQWVGQVVPGYAKIGEIDRTREEFQIDGRTFHRPRFATASGQAKLHVHALSPLRGERGQLRLMTVRSEGQFNTVVYEEADLYRGQTRRDVVLLHPSDLAARGLEAGQRVWVRSETGSCQVRAESFPRIKPGNALMYYPEANVLVSRHADPRSRTPAFKGTVVTVESAETNSPVATG